MLTVVDPHTRSRTHLAARPGRLTQIGVALPAVQGEVAPGELRAVVVADLLRRVLEEVHSQQVMVTVAGPGLTRQALHQHLHALWIPDPAATVDPADTGNTAEPLGAVDVLVTAAGADTPGDGVLRLPVAAVRGHAEPVDPTDLRLLLLSWHHTESVRLGAAELALAAATLRRWRDFVAAWATQPSSPMPEQVKREAYAACDDNLNISQVLGLLHHVEQDTTIPEGAKFETFAHLDRILALNLTAHLGAQSVR